MDILIYAFVIFIIIFMWYAFKNSRSDKSINYIQSAKDNEIVADLTKNAKDRNFIHSTEFQNGIQSFLKGNYTEAFEIFEPLAEQENAAAQTMLGVLYGDGKGVSQNYNEAAKWWRLAAEQGDIKAQNFLGGLLIFFDQNGNDVSQCYREGKKWLRLASEQGHADSQFSLGVVHRLGLTVPRSDIHAYMWMSIAKDNGSMFAENSLKIMEMSLTPEEIEKAKANAIVCINSGYKDIEDID